MKLRIVSNGHPSGTQVLDELGNRIENVQSISWKIRADEFSTAIIELKPVRFETWFSKSKETCINKRWIRCVKDEVVEESDLQE